ncbi:hypothetical protein LRD18_10850 [Halorhodospira halochloris]|uniref:hypothetical protein n=1 Tax=Halorhodospira halochloris TaxID=1052 RepID=UPI001EE9A319|nr:hypothetical protein [Halorhodospira halochloris]MCG5531347.1 hypothetical protein [Halorhodospira halochloris]
MRIKALAVSASLLALAGCGYSTPGCSDSDTISLVKEIAYDELVNQAGSEIADSVSMEVKAIRTRDHNESADTYECAADLELTGEVGTESVPIEYTIESTDTGDEFYVEVYGL